MRLFKAIWHEKQILIVLLWSGLIFIGYTVLTVQADEKEDIVDAIRGMEFTNDDNDDTGLKPIAIEQACKDNGGEWKDNSWCKFDKDKTGDEVEFEHQLEDRGLSYYYDDKEDGSEEWDKYQQEKQEKEICKNHDGEWLINANECKFDDNGDQDSVDFDHTMEEKGLWDDYVADKRPYNPNDIDSDNDGIYDDEELSEEEEERLVDAPKVITGDDVEEENDDDDDD